MSNVFKYPRWDEAVAMTLKVADTDAPAYLESKIKPYRKDPSLIGWIIDAFSPITKKEIYKLGKIYVKRIKQWLKAHKVKKEDTLFFFDPPYSYNQKMKVYKHYKFDFVSFRMLIDKLDEAGYKFLITIDNSPEIRELFKDYKLHDEEWKYTSSNTHNCEVKTGKELFITNYEI